MSETNSDQTFKVGLCMAGAVSAGAYTAGVMDFLLEALETWEQRRGQAGVPTHRVEIPVMGGASAGGMTAIITAASLNNTILHFNEPDQNDLMAERPENKLYHSWVDLIDTDMLKHMLSTGDIKPGHVLSALNSQFIDKIADRAVQVDTSEKAWKPLPPFFSKDLKVFTTLSNLQGFEYDVSFRSETSRSRYYMQQHGDFACFQLCDEAISGANQGWMPLNFKTKENVETARNAAMATGAFPVGLQARILKRDGQYINANEWIIKPNAGSYKKAPDGPYPTLNVDGGLINNEPFDLIRSYLARTTGQTNVDDYEDFKQFKSTILMIDPFPSAEAKAIKQSPKLLNVVSATLSAMISQMRAKPLQISKAMESGNAAQYLITPSRWVPAAKGQKADGEKGIHVEGDKAIACGTLDGFGGFLSKEFRIHDYFLGRFNCKSFLRDYFTIPEEAANVHPVFSKGYEGVDANAFRSKKDNTRQIIPIFDDAVEVKFPAIVFRHGETWPMLREEDIDKYRGAIKDRIQAVVLNVFEMGRLNTFLLWAGAKVLLNRKLSDSVLRTIKDSLTEWNLLKK